MIHQNEPPGNKGVTLNGQPITAAQAEAIRKALGITGNGQVTLKAGDVLTVPWGNPADVQTLGTAVDVEFAFVIPEGRPGIDGIGSVDAVEAVGVPYGQSPDVINFGTPERAKLRFYVPAGPPGAAGANGTGVPANPIEGFVVGYKNGVIQWVPAPTGTGTGTGGTTTVINNVYNVGSLLEAYSWEGGVVLPPPDPTPVDPPPTTSPMASVFDATTYSGYSAAIAAAAAGSKRQAAATYLINTFGTAQKLTMKRNGAVVLVANYAGSLVQTTVGSDMALTLATLGSVSSLGAADSATGTWTMELSGGANFAATITEPASMDAATAAGQGFNPGPITLILSTSLEA